jgi:flagellar basal body rod protein FlgB
MIDGLTNSDGISALQRLMQFTGQRQRVILNNIANLSTPGFRPADVSPEAFQAQLAEAIDAKRAGRAPPIALGVDDGEGGGFESADSALPIRSTREVEALPDRLVLHPEPTSDNILFHDGNDRSVERVMQSLVENFMAYRAAAQLMRNRIELINTAIRERI